MAKEKVLVVDDEEVIRISISNVLGDNYDVELAASGKEAFEKIKEKRFDVVLLDIKMPGMSGLEALIDIKLASPPTAVIMVSALDMADTAWKAFQGGAVSYITKPFKGDDLIREIEKVLERKRAMDKDGRKGDLINELYGKAKLGGKFGRRVDYFSDLFTRRSCSLGQISVEDLEELVAGKLDEEIATGKFD